MNPVFQRNLSNTFKIHGQTISHCSFNHSSLSNKFTLIMTTRFIISGCLLHVGSCRLTAKLANLPIASSRKKIQSFQRQ